MRTRVTLEKDVERMLHEAMRDSKRSFKETLNAAIRAGLSQPAPRRKGKPFKVKAKPMALRPGIDPAGLNKLADELEIGASVESASGKKRT